MVAKACRSSVECVGCVLGRTGAKWCIRAVERDVRVPRSELLTYATFLRKSAGGSLLRSARGAGKCLQLGALAAEVDVGLNPQQVMGIGTRTVLVRSACVACTCSGRVCSCTCRSTGSIANPLCVPTVCCVQVAAWLLAAGARCGVATGNQWAPNHLSCVVSHAGGSSKRQRSGIRIRVRQRSVSRSSVVKSRGDKSWQQAMNNIQL